MTFPFRQSPELFRPEEGSREDLSELEVPCPCSITALPEDRLQEDIDRTAQIHQFVVDMI